MTQRDKLMHAVMFAQHVKNIAKSIAFDARDYDESWPLGYSRELERLANEFLKLK